MSADLKDCPFCGSDRIYVNAIRGACFYECKACQARGPAGKEGDGSSVELWNRRHDPGAPPIDPGSCKTCGNPLGEAVEVSILIVGWDGTTAQSAQILSGPDMEISVRDFPCSVVAVIVSRGTERVTLQVRDAGPMTSIVRLHLSDADVSRLRSAKRVMP